MDEMNAASVRELQLKEAKKQSFWAKVCGLSAILFVCIVFCTALFISARLNRLYEAAMETTANLNKVSRELAEIDFETMTGDVSALVNEAESSLADTMEKVDSIDIDTLNKSIAELQQILEPVSKFFGSFQR